MSDQKLGASMSMRVYKGSPKPMTFVSLRHDFLATTDMAGKVQFDVEVGTDEDAGKLRIVPNKSGAFASRMLKAGTLILDLGYLPSLGEKPHANQPAHVALVDGAAIVTVPEWPEHESEDDEADFDDEDKAPEPPPRQSARLESLPNPLPEKPAKAAPKAPVSAPPKPPGAAAKRTYNGVTIDLTPQREAVSYKGEIMPVSPRGARLIEALARAMPSCIDDSRLIAFAWEGRAPQGGSVALDMVCADLKVLKKIGLEVRPQKGVGRQLISL